MADIDATIRFCEERAASYGALRQSATTAIALDRAIEVMRGMKPEEQEFTYSDETSILPDQLPETMQLWPLGHGVVLMTTTVHQGNGLLITVGVPDTLAGRAGEAMEGDPDEIIRRLVVAPGNQSSIMVFPDGDAVDRMIEHLNTIKQQMKEHDD